MIPLDDDSRRTSYFSLITVSIIAINVIVFVLELMGGEDFVMQWALVPADIVAGRNWITLLTSMFLHGGWLHILSNMGSCGSLAQRLRRPWAVGAILSSTCWAAWPPRWCKSPSTRPPRR